MIIKKGLNIFISSATSYDGTLEIGHCSIIGDYNDDKNKVIIGSNVTIGTFCKIESNVKIGNKCMIEDNCSIYHSTIIGNGVQIVSGSRISARCSIGNECIINGIISQRVVIEDNVRYFGRIAHSHHNHTLPWKTTVESSPIFRKGCFVGVNALIIGDIEIGENSYIAAGEIVRCNIPSDTIYYKGKIYDKKYFRGVII